MKVKTLFIFIVLNIFTLLAVTILYEYIAIEDKLSQLEHTVNLSMDRAIYNSTASEELFTEKFANASGLQVYSYGSSNGAVGGANDISNSICVWDGNKFVSANAYGLTMQNVGFPLTKVNGTGWTNSPKTYNSTLLATINGYDSTQVYTYLYGKVTNDYNKTSLAWSNRGTKETKIDANNAQAVLNPASNALIGNLHIAGYYTPSGVRQDFADYYKKVGSKIVTANFIKHKESIETLDGAGNTVTDYRFSLNYQTYPVLADMGLSAEAYDGYNYSSGSADIMTDNWCQVAKIGKKVKYSSIGSTTQRSYYYLTPNSLGITYIPKDVCKETFIANLDTVCRLQKLSSSQIVYDNKASLNNTDVKTLINGATGCIKDGEGRETSVFVGGGSTAQTHIVGTDENIINDGIIEYDLNSVQMKIEYFVVDFWNKNNALVINRCVGQVDKAYELTNTLSVALENNVTDYKNNDSGYLYMKSLNTKQYYLNGSLVNMKLGYETNKGNTVVAKVTTRLKVHIPYDNAIMQWAVYLYTGHSTGAEHYDIKMFDDYQTAMDIREGSVSTEDGVWYQTSAYYAITN